MIPKDAQAENVRTIYVVAIHVAGVVRAIRGNKLLRLLADAGARYRGIDKEVYATLAADESATDPLVTNLSRLFRCELSRPVTGRPFVVFTYCALEVLSICDPAGGAENSRGRAPRILPERHPSHS